MDKISYNRPAAPSGNRGLTGASNILQKNRDIPSPGQVPGVPPCAHAPPSRLLLPQCPQPFLLRLLHLLFSHLALGRSPLSAFLPLFFLSRAPNHLPASPLFPWPPSRRGAAVGGASGSPPSLQPRGENEWKRTKSQKLVTPEDAQR